MTRLDPAVRCQHRNADGFQCRMTRTGNGASLCTFHARREERERSRQTSDSSGVPRPALKPLTLSIPPDFRTATSLNHFIRNLIIEFSHDRVDTRKAAVLGYLCQLELQSLTHVRREIWDREPLNAQEALKQLLKEAAAYSRRTEAEEKAEPASG